MITRNLSIDGALQYEGATKNITASRVPPYLAAFLVEATTRPANTTAARYAERMPRALSSISRFHPRDIPATSTAAAVSLPVHATVAGTSRSNKCYQRAAFAPPPKRASRVNDVRPRGGNCPEAMQPPHSSADRATSDPPKPRELELGASYRE